MTSPRRALILANGDPPSAALLARLVFEHDIFIATDGAANIARALGCAPEIISGDFDSLSQDAARRDFPGVEIIPTPDQNQGDLEKAIEIARERGATSITLTGAAGGRLDHTLGTIALLLRYHGEVDIRLVDERSEARACSGTWETPGEWSFPTAPGDLVSIVSFDGLARVTLRGVQWPLENHRMPTGTLGISNRATAECVVLRVYGGALIASHLSP